MHRLSAFAVVLVLPTLAFAGDVKMVFDGNQPSPIKPGQTAEGRAVLFGPVDVPAALKTPGQVIHLTLEGVTFSEQIGSDSGIYLVDAAAKTKQIKISPRMYVGSAANVIGGRPAKVDIHHTIHDYKVGEVEHRPLTKLRGMKSVYLALVVRAGDVKFERAVIDAKPLAPADGGAR